MAGVKPANFAGDLTPCHSLLPALRVDSGMDGRRVEPQDLGRSGLGQVFVERRRLIASGEEASGVRRSQRRTWSTTALVTERLVVMVLIVPALTGMEGVCLNGWSISAASWSHVSPRARLSPSSAACSARISNSNTEAPP
jgi:hypothetical protein